MYEEQAECGLLSKRLKQLAPYLEQYQRFEQPDAMLNTDVWQSALNRKNNNILIYPGSVIYIPREVKSRDASLVASIWAPIISASATSITALSVLNKQ